VPLAAYMIRVVGVALAIAYAAVGRWVYFHPERLWRIACCDLLPEPLGNFFLRFAKFFGAVMLFLGTYGVACELLLLLFHALRIPDSSVALIVATSALLAVIATVSVLKHPSSQHATEK